MTDLQSAPWADIPMGPALREYLGIDDNDYRGHGLTPSNDRYKAFSRFFLEYSDKAAPASMELFVAMLEELTGMRLGALCLSLAERYSEFGIEENFRALLALGSASMLEAQLDDAIDLLKAANALDVMEPAPYANLAEIYFSRHEDQQAKEWATKGLQMNPNYQRLWEVFAGIHLSTNREAAGSKVRKLAEELNSYCGLTLAAELINPGDSMLKAELLATPYSNGERATEYLIEYTAALGLARQYEKIPPIIWQAEQIDQIKLPWQLYAHAAQAQLALNNEKQARELIDKAQRTGDLPKDIKRDLESVYEEHLSH